MACLIDLEKLVRHIYILILIMKTLLLCVGFFSRSTSYSKLPIGVNVSVSI